MGKQPEITCSSLEQGKTTSAFSEELGGMVHPGEAGHPRAHLLSMALASWMTVPFRWPCSLSLVPPLQAGHRKTVGLGRRGIQERPRRVWQDQSCSCHQGWGASELCVACLLLHPFSLAVPKQPPGRASKMYPVVSLACLWKAPPNKQATAHKARAGYAFPMISVCLPLEDNPTARVRAGTQHIL